MKCFYHADIDAVVVCASCYRGLCHECAVEVDRMSACRNRCEQDIKKDLEYNNALKERETKAMNIGGTSYNLFAVMQLLFGLFFSFTALYLIPQDDESDAYNFLRKFLLLVGVIFAASTIPILIIAKRFKNKELAASNEK